MHHAGAGGNIPTLDQSGGAQQEARGGTASPPTPVSAESTPTLVMGKVAQQGANNVPPASAESTLTLAWSEVAQQEDGIGLEQPHTPPAGADSPSTQKKMEIRPTKKTKEGKFEDLKLKEIFTTFHPSNLNFKLNMAFLPFLRLVYDFIWIS